MWTVSLIGTPYEPYAKAATTAADQPQESPQLSKTEDDITCLLLVPHDDAMPSDQRQSSSSGQQLPLAEILDDRTLRKSAKWRKWRKWRCGHHALLYCYVDTTAA
jgi:hypothetical protein